MIRSFTGIVSLILILFSTHQAQATNYFWVGGTGSWTDLTHWATASGGSTKHTTLPTSADDVFFDANSFTATGQIVTVTDGATCRTMDWSAATNSPTISSTLIPTVNIYGGLLLPATVLRNFTGDIHFKATSGTHNVDLGNQPLRNPNNETLYFEGAGGTWTLTGGINIYGVSLTGGTLNTNGQPITCSVFGTTGSTAQVINLGSSSITTGTWNVTSSNITVVPGTSTITSTGTVATFNGKNLTYNNLIIDGTSSVSGSNTFNTITINAGSTLKLKEGTTQTISNLVSNGTSGSPVTIKSVTDGSAATLSKASGTIAVNYARIQDNIATGGASFTAPTGSVDLGNVTGWNITVSEPTKQVTSLSFTKVVGTSMDLRWTVGDGTKRIVVAKQGGPVDSAPVDFATGYTAGAFGAGTQLGTGNYIVYMGNSDRATISGLTAGTAYYFAVYEFSGTDATANYNTTSPATGNKTTLPSTAVIISNSPLTICSGQYYDTGGNDLYNYSNSESFTQTLTPATAGNKLKMDFSTNYDFYLGNGDVLKIYDGANTSATLIGTYTAGTSPGIVAATNAAGQLTIQFTSDASIPSVGFGADISCYVPAPATQPTVASTALAFSNVSGSSMTLSWTKGNGNNRLVLIRALNAVAFAPVDGTEYPANASFGSGTNLGSGQYVVYNGTGNTATVTNLTSNTAYYFSVIEYNKDATTTPNYMTTGLTGNRTTLAIAAEPTLQATAITNSYLTDTNAEFNLTAGNGARRVAVLKQGSAVDATPVDGTLYTANGLFTSATDLGNGSKVVASTSSTYIPISGLSPSTTYYLSVYEFNGTTAGTPNYLLTTPATFSFTTLPALAPSPTVLPSYTGISADFNSITVKWTAGDAEKVLVVVRPNGGGIASVSDRVEYAYSSVYGQGAMVSTNGYAVYSGANKEVTVTGLQIGTSYDFIIWGYNGSGNVTNYTLQSPYTTITTLKKKPTVQASNVTITNVAADSMKISWQKGNGDRSMVVVRADNPVSFSIKDSTDINIYNTNYGEGFDLGNGNIAVFASSGSSVVVKKLTPATTYHVGVYEYNSSYFSNLGKYINYFLTTNAPVANATTSASGKNYYWVQGTGKWSDYQHHWATASGGGTFHSSVPTSFDNVYFDAASFNTDKDTVYFDKSIIFKDMDWTAITKKATFISSGTSKCSNVTSVYGSIKLSSLMSIDMPYLYLYGTKPGNVINLAGKKRFSSTCGGGYVYMWGYGGEWTLSEDLTINSLTMYAGTLIVPNSTITILSYLQFYNQTSKKLDLGNSTISVPYISGGTDANRTVINGGKFNFTGVGISLEVGKSNLKKVNLQGTTYGTVKILGTVAIDSLVIAPGREVQFEAGKTFSIDRLICNGDSARTTKITSTVKGSTAFFSKTTGSIDINYVQLVDNTAIGGAQFNASNSVDGGNVSGWNITNPEVFVPKKSASGIVYLKALRNNMKIKWLLGDGIRRIVIVKEGAAVDAYPADNKTYTASTVFGSGNDLGNGNFVVYDGVRDTTSVTGLTPGKMYHIAILEYNTWAGKTKYKRTSPAISNVATVGTNDILFSGDAVSAGNVKYFDDGGNGAYVKNKNGTQTITPATAGTKLGVLFSYFELGVFDSLVVYDGPSTASPVIGKYRTSSAVPSQALVATNASGALTFRLKGNNSSEQEEAFKGWVAEFFNVGTVAAEPTQATALTVTGRTENSLTLKVTKGNGSGRVIVAHEATAVTRQPTDALPLTGNATFGAGTLVGDNNYIVYSGADEGVEVTGLKANTIYHFAAYEYNGSASTINFNVSNSPVVKDTTLLALPTVPSTAFNLVSKGNYNASFKLTQGNGTSRLIVVRKGKEVAFNPVDGKSYTASSAFTGGQNLGDSTYVVFNTSNGSFSTFDLSSLQMLTRYYVKVFEYNTSGKRIRYLTSQTLSANFVTAGPTLKMKKINDNYCAGGTIEVPYETTGFFLTANKFTAQVSNAQGAFGSPVIVKDTLLAPGSAIKSTIKLKIPATIASGSYKVRVLASNPVIVGDSARAMVITNVPDVTISKTADGFSSSSTVGNQWYRNGNVIEGATAQTYSSTDDGSYTVKVTMSGCSKTSSPIVIMGIEESETLVNLYPNPTYKELVIEHTQHSGVFQVLDTQGRELINGNLDEQRTILDVNILPQGVYLLKVTTREKTSVSKFVKK